MSLMRRLSRGQELCVIMEGPYRIVRQPSDPRLMLGSPGTSLALSSVWSLLPAAILMIVMVIRTAPEAALPA